MIPEIDIAGIFISSVVPTALLALTATALAHRLLRGVGAYRHIWHPALFDTSLFLLFWALITALPLGL